MSNNVERIHRLCLVIAKRWKQKNQRIAEKARRDARIRFTSLFHLMNKEIPHECFKRQRGVGTNRCMIKKPVYSPTAIIFSVGGARPRRWVRLLFATSLLMTSVGCVTTGNESPVLTQQDLENPDAIVAVLKKGVSKENKATANTFYQQGIALRAETMKGKRGWGAAAKTFGESALYNPSPLALMDYVHAILRDFGSWHPARKTKDMQTKQLAWALQIYRSAQAADNLLPELSDKQRSELNEFVSCLDGFVSKGEGSDSCRPLKWAGLIP